MIKTGLKIALVFFVVLMLDGRLPAQAAGSLDRSFGTNGVTLASVTRGGINAVAVQPADGKILIGGYDAQSNFMVIRFNPNGTPDANFGDGGVVRTQIFPENSSGGTVNSLAIQPDGKIIAAGTGSYNISWLVLSHITVVRYNADGSLDTTFDGDGKATVLVNGVGTFGDEAALQADGKIVVAGWNHENVFVVVRFQTDGSLDPTFGAGGAVTTSFSSGFYSKARDVKIQPDGKIVAAGYSENPTASFTAARYKTDGSLDETFGAGGKVVVNINASDYASSMALQADDKIILAGTTQITTGGATQFGMARLNPNGSLDSTFGASGKITTRFGHTAVSYDVAVQSDGRIIVAGEGNEIAETRDFALVRYLPDGSPDASFDGDGKVLTSLLGHERATALALDNSGKIIVTGETNPGDAVGNRFAVVRYNSRAAGAAFCDFDGDGRTDVSVFRPSNGSWYRLNSSNNAFIAVQFGASGDLIAPADFDGDGKTDISIFRPTDGGWYRLNSANNTFSAAQFGTNGDLPAPGDFDGDAKADISIFRPSAGSWYRVNSSNNQFVAAQFGANGDKPIVADFDGDGKSDLAVFRSTDGGWYRVNSSNSSLAATQFGSFGDLPVAADYDGDGKTDLAVFRPSNGTWYRINSGNNSFAAHQFGISEDKPASGDFDGDGKSDSVVFRPSSGTWYLLRSTAGFTGIQFGASGDVPAPNAFVR